MTAAASQGHRGQIVTAAEHLKEMLTAGGRFPTLSQVLAVLRPDADTGMASDLVAALRRLNVPHSLRNIGMRELGRLIGPALLVDAAGTTHLVTAVHSDLGLRVVGDGTSEARWIGVPDGRLRIVEIAQAEDRPKAPDTASMAATLAAMVPQLWPLALISFVINVLGLATPLFVMTIYDTALPARSVQAVAVLALGLCLAYGVEVWMRRIRRDAMVHMVAEFEDRMGLALLRKTLALPLAAISRSDAYRQQTRLRRFEGIRDALSGPLMQAIFDLPFLLIFGVALFLIAPVIGWIVVACVIASLLILAGITPLQRQRDLALADHQDEHRRRTEEAVERQADIRRHGLAMRVRTELDASFETLASASGHAQALRQSTALGLQALLLVTGLGASYHATRLAVQGDLPMGALIAALILVWRFLAPVQILTTASQQALSVFESVRVIDALFAMPEERYRGVTEGPVSDIGPPVQFDQVTLRFPDAAMPALLGVSFEIPVGQVVAVAGRTMSGKTCLAELVAGLHWPSAGRVLAAGRMIRQLPLDDLRASLAYCPQTVQIFPGSIRQNLEFAAPLASDAAMWAALADAGATETVRGLPKGLDTETNLTGPTALPNGLLQQISLAMAFLRPGPIHIFDQPTDGLSDTAAEAVRAAIRRRGAAGAVLLISNDLADLAIADRTIVLDRGRIVSNDRGKRGRDRAAALLYQGHAI